MTPATPHSSRSPNTLSLPLLIPTLVVLASIAPLSWAGQVDRGRVTLGALADEADAVVVATVAQVDSSSADLRVARVLKGRAPERLALSNPAPELGLRRGERVALFLARDARGVLVSPRVSWARVALPDPAGEAQVVDAIRSRLPRLDGPPDALRQALFRQLTSTSARVRDDAAHDLVAFRNLSASPAERGRLATALARPGPTAPTLAPLLELAERLPDLRHQPALIRIARSATHALTRRLAGRALQRLDPAAARESFRIDLTAPRTPTAISAVRGLGSLRSEAAAAALIPALGDGRAEVQRAALSALATSRTRDPKTLAAIERVAGSSPDAATRRRALAALATCGAGKALARLAAEGNDPAVRALAERLQRDPIREARRLLRED